MAFPTTANTTTALLQQLNFRGAGNTPISSLYTLYANGHGLTYWSNSVNPEAISSLSTAIGNVYTQVEADLQTAILSTNVATSTLIFETLGDVTSVSTQFSNYETTTNSTLAGILINEASLSTSVNQVSTGVNAAFLSTANSFQIQLDSYYQSTMNASLSTINSISSISSFYSQIQSTTNLTQYGLSSLSTALYTQNTSTYNSLLDITNTGLTSTAVWTASELGNLSSMFISIDALNTFSTDINYALLSTSISFQSTLTGNVDELANHEARIENLEALSTSLSTITYEWISSFYSTNIYSVNVTAQDQSTLLGNSISSVQNFSTQYFYTISNMNASTNINTINISNLSYQFSIITTSSILAGIYDSFIQLENYTVGLINSTAQASYDLISTTTSTTYGTIGATQLITLDTSNFYASLDFANYRNFNIQMYSLADISGSVYRIGYNPNAISTSATYQGLITIDINTIGQTYTQNNNLLALDISRWGILNNSYERIFPMVANSDYTIEYQYNNLNGILYANLLNIYPRMSTSAVTTSSINGNSLGAGIYSTGTQIAVSWSNYLFSTFTLPNIYAQTNVNFSTDPSTIMIYGPYRWPISTAVIAMPFNTQQLGQKVPVLVETYITGQYAYAASTIIQLLNPLG